MQAPIVESNEGVTLVGGGHVFPGELDRALALAPRLVAADGGADLALRHGLEPEAVIGDLDSISGAASRRLAGRLHRIAEQETTDFDKALRSIAAPLVLAVGFTGARLDHTLGMFNALARHPERRCIALGGADICFLCPARLTLRLPIQTRLSLFPMSQAAGQSQGLRWPLDGLDFAPGALTGLSNQTTAPEVSISMSGRMLVLLPAEGLAAAVAALAGT